jgi:hypothetical protein
MRKDSTQKYAIKIVMRHFRVMSCQISHYWTLKFSDQRILCHRPWASSAVGQARLRLPRVGNKRSKLNKKENIYQHYYLHLKCL